MLLTLLSEQCIVLGVHGAVANGADDGVMSRLVTVAGRDDVHLSLLSPQAHSSLTHLFIDQGKVFLWGFFFLGCEDVIT